MLTLLLLFPASIFSIVFYLLPSQSTARRSQPHDSFWCTRDIRCSRMGMKIAVRALNSYRRLHADHLRPLKSNVEIFHKFRIHR